MGIKHVCNKHSMQVLKDDKVIELRYYSNKSIRMDYYSKKTTNYDFLWDGQEESMDLNDFLFCQDEGRCSFKNTAADSSVEVCAQNDMQNIEFKRNGVSVKLEEYNIFEKRINNEMTSGGKLKFAVSKKQSYYGLGQQQNNVLDYAGHKVEVFHNYKAKGGETIGVPVLISSEKYAIIVNNPAQTVVDLEIDGIITWEIDCTKDISVVIVFGETIKELYKEIKLVVGEIPLPLKSSLGYIQCKQRYESQEEILEVAKKYREKKYPIDMMVVDWFYWQYLGDMDLWTKDWPTPKMMTQELQEMNLDCMISVWPRFMKESRNYAYLEQNGFFVKDETGETVYGTPDDQRGALIDTTNQDASKWYWDTIYNNLAQKGFNAWWTDENEPDLWPYDYQLHAGKGYEIFNLYPYTHTKAIYEGHREKCKDRCCILSRSAFLGAQRFGTQFWSSDIYPTWGVLEKQIPTAINFSATGMGYWSSDIGGWQSLPDYRGKSSFTASELLLETQGSTEGVVLSDEFPELYVRWFQFGAFSPIFRAHGTRDENEVWSYGEAQEVILVKILKLRYKLMPYIYSMAYLLMRDNTPILRGMFLEFDDIECKNCKSQYMFGDSILVAPVTEKGSRTKKVYLPSGQDWYFFWNNKKYQGGQYVEVQAPIDEIPLFIKENSILPMQDEVESTKQTVDKINLKVYGTGDSYFELYEDDGTSYKYENGVFDITNIAIIDKKLNVSGSRVAGAFLVEFIQ